jgi:hypothetical protein
MLTKASKRINHHENFLALHGDSKNQYLEINYLRDEMAKKRLSRGKLGSVISVLNYPGVYDLCLSWFFFFTGNSCA